jgi:superfamily II DNA/RNA helicase
VQFVPVKNIVHESSASASRSQEEIKKWLETNQVSLSGQDIPTPVFEFCEAGFPKQIVDVLIRNYQKPSVIQSISWPVALAGRDMISIAKTGSGKTLGVSFYVKG